MARGEAHHFDRLTHEAFHRDFGKRLEPDLGRTARRDISCRLRSEKLDVETNLEEIFSISLVKSLEYLVRNGSSAVRDPNLWFRKICWNETTAYLISMHKRSHQRLEDLLEGVGVLTTPPPLSDEDLYHLVNIAIDHLRPQHRQLILLDFVARKEPEEIRRTMGLKSINYFRKVKCEAFKALATAIKSLIEQGVENFF